MKVYPGNLLTCRMTCENIPGVDYHGGYTFAVTPVLFPSDTCDVQPVFRNIIGHCRDEYGWTNDDTKDYLTGWVAPSPGNMRRYNIKDCYMDDLLGNETSLR